MLLVASSPGPTPFVRPLLPDPFTLRVDAHNGQRDATRHFGSAETLIGQSKLTEMNLLVAVAVFGKRLFKEGAEGAAFEAVVIVFSFPSTAKQATVCHANEVVAHRWLRLVEQGAERFDMHLAILRQRKEDLQTRGVGQELQGRCQFRQRILTDG